MYSLLAVLYGYSAELAKLRKVRLKLPLQIDLPSLRVRVANIEPVSVARQET
jgi:hypothetical protein